MLLHYKQSTARITKEQIKSKERRKELIHIKVEIDNGKRSKKNQ